MSWTHTARQKQLAPVGFYKPETFRVTVHDSFHQFALRKAAQCVGSKDVPEFFLFCVRYVVDHHRDLKRFRKVFRQGVKAIKAAAAVPVDDSEISPYVTRESVRDRRRREAFERFARWAEGEL